MNYHNFENYLVANGESWAKYVCGDLGYKIKMHRRYATYLEAIEIKKTDRSPANQSNNTSIKESVACKTKNLNY